MASAARNWPASSPNRYCIGFASHSSATSHSRLKEPGRDPREYRHDNQPDQQRQQIAPDRLDPLGGIDAPNGASRIIAYSERRGEQSDTHGEDDDHGIMHLVDADHPRDRKQQRAEQHDRRNALEHATQHRESDDRYGDKRRGAAG